MKIRNKYLLGFAGRFAALALKLLIRTLRFDYFCVGTQVIPAENIALGERYVFSMWHEYVLLPIFKFGHPNMAGLVSKHADGQLLGHLLASVRMGMVAGSTNRGGVEAIRQILRDKDVHRHLVVTPDGPRGPRRVAQVGVVYIASRTEMLLVPVGVGYKRLWRAKSWDRFAVPRPFTRARLITGEPVAIPAGLKLAQLEAALVPLQAEMDRLNALAEEWAVTGLLDPRCVLASMTNLPPDRPCRG